MEYSLVDYLKELVFGLSEQVFARAIQCEVFQLKGFSKLHKKYTEHLAEEREYMGKAIEQILKLGGKINLADNKKNDSSVKTNTKCEVYENPIDYLNHEYEVSKNGLVWLKDVVKKAEMEDEYIVQEFLIEYYKDEQEDFNWTLAQLNLIKTIGEENWIVNQI